MVYIAEMDVGTGLIGPEMASIKGKELSQEYNEATPFPNIVIDDFLPIEILDLCLKEFPTTLGSAGVGYNRDQERLKSQYNPDELSPVMRQLFYSFNSAPFIKILENITGIDGLIPDPYFLGAGFHRVAQGGHLSVHADFNHHKIMNLERRINLLLYLNRDWSPDFGGQLEFWDQAMEKRVKAVTPIFNRCVIFNTTLSSYHGNPEPVNHPDGLSRKSIALYYYTSTWTADKRDRTTQFKSRPGRADKADIRVALTELLIDITPPVARRGMAKLRNHLSRAQR